MDDHRHRSWRFPGLCPVHLGRYPVREAGESLLEEEEDQSADWCDGLERRAYGKPRVQRDCHEVRPEEPRAELLYVQ